MLRLRTFIALLPCFHLFSAAVSSPGQDSSPWLIGCVNASLSSFLSLYALKGARDLDPATCSGRCRDEGYQIAALSSGSCYCDNQLNGLVVSECFNTSSSEGTKDVKGGGGGERQSAPYLHLVNGRQGNVALYRTEGPFLHSVSVSMSPETVQTGETFVVDVSGTLAGRPHQPTGFVVPGEQDLSYVTVEFLGMTPKGQSSRHVNVLDDGSFSVSSEWVLKTPGRYEINVRVSNLLSTLSSTLHLSVLQSSPSSLLISLLHGPLGVPSCIPLIRSDSSSVTVEAAYQGDPLTLRVYVGEGLATHFHWWVSNREKEENVESVRTACPSDCSCLNSSVKWTFDTEGAHTVSVNASSTNGWTQETIHVMVVRPLISDLRGSVSGTQLTAGEVVSVDVELFTTMKHLLVLSLTLKPAYDLSVTKKDRNITRQHNLRQHHGNTCWHGDSHSHLHHHPTSSPSSCQLHLHLQLRLPTTTGQYHLVASVLSTTDPSSVLLSTVLHQTLMVYQRICALRPSGTWMSVVSTHAELSLEVSSHTNHMGSRVVWTFSLNDVVVVNKTIEEWSINVTLPDAGRYTVTVQAYNPVSRASFQSQILVQDPVGELVLNIPSRVVTDEQHLVLLCVTAGSNVTITLLVNTTVLYRNSSYTTGTEAAVVLLFNHTGTVVVELRAENRVSSQNRSVIVCVKENRKSSPQAKINLTWQPPTSPFHSMDGKAVRIFAAKQAYPTNTDVIFQTVADVPDPVEFLWHFGDSRSTRTTSRTITKRYQSPGSYDVVVVVSHGGMSVTSDVFPLVVQRAVKLNRLVHHWSVLQNQTMTVSCRVNTGTNLSFLWSFGDGTTTSGQRTQQHIFHRTGEFRLEVTVSNLVSSASLSSHIFVVDRPCQPPPVKNMGPLKLQVRRFEVVRLGVTYETEADCDISGVLHYTWTLYDSVGQIFPLPLIDTHRQSLVLQSHLLQYDTYTAIARVQVVGSVVYSNYSVRVQVMPSSPVASIQGGTNVFINNRTAAMVTLDGHASYDPDFPMNPLSYSWTCKPVSSISSSCFNQHIPTSSPRLKFPISFLKHNFDQFQFTFTAHSGERSASSETFLSVTSNLVRKVFVHCPQCQGDHVTWDQSFSVRATCEDCDIPAEDIHYTWSLYLVNASSKPVTDVMFCYTVDLSAPSAIVESPDASPQTPGISTLHPSAGNTSQYNHTDHASPPSPFNISKTKASPRRRRRSTSNKAGLSESEPSTSPLVLDSGGVLYSDHSELDLDSSTDWEFFFPVLEGDDVDDRLDPDYDVSFPAAEEGDPGMPAGRRTGVDGESFSAADDSAFDPVLHEDEGSNLVDPKPSVVIQEPTLLDLPRDPVDKYLFESFTYTGISSPSLIFRPFSLRPGSRYMLEVTAESQNSLLGRTQLFLKTNPAPKGMTCQVQPVKGLELHTHFSIFCTSGREDLVYEYSFSVGGGCPRRLYQGRDFQYYFSLPSGDPSNDYEVTIYTKIRSSTYGSATKPCPVTVQVQPVFLRDTSSSSSASHHHPDLELSESGLRNLSALVQLGNSVEIRNYISLLSSILNRLSLDSEANANAQRHMRNVLICTVCKLESSEQESMVDNICILKDLLQVTNQVTLVSARRVTAHVQGISEQFSESSAPDDANRTLNVLVSLLSYSLQAVTAYDSTPETPNSADTTQALESVLPTGDAPNDCNSSCEKGGSIPTKKIVQLVTDVLQTASDLMLKYILFHETQEHRVSTDLITLSAACQNQTSTVISSGSTTFYLPASLIQILFVHSSGDTERRQRGPCVLRVLTELMHSPYIWTRYPTQLSGPVVDLSLYQCRTRRKIHIRSLVQPINIELQHPQRHKSSVSEYILPRSQINYHSFSITQEHLQQAIQLTVMFTPPPNKAFPIMLLFRMFERPTPSMHHLHRIHRWESNTARITLLPSYLNAAGIGHLALLSADFGKAPRGKHLSEQISYSLTVDSRLCLSWDDQQGAWTHHGCRTRQADTTSAVNCSCHQLKPVTVVQQQIQNSHDTADLDPFLSGSSDLTVLAVLLVCVCLYIPGLVVCRRADVVSEENQRVHYLSDNSPSDPYLYAVTIHTGLCSAASMSAKVYIVLYGEDGSSQTRELQIPGHTLFRRNSQDTFMLSAADSLGAVWGVHMWHDNTGPSPEWYLKQVEVSEVNKGSVNRWLFVGQCWLAVNKGDGRVERTLRVCTKGIGFSKMMRLKLSDYLADFHIWMSVYSCPCPSSSTHTQRLTMCLLLLLGYACINAVIISQLDDQLPFEWGFIDVSAASLTTALVSVVAVLPVATVISFLFRLRGVKLTGSKIQHVEDRMTERNCFEDALSVNESVSEPHLSWSVLQQWAQEAWRNKNQDTDLLSVSTAIPENKDTSKESVIQPDVVIRKEDVLAFERSVEPVLQNLLLVSKGNNADQAPRGTDSSRFNEFQKACLSATRDEVVPKGNDPQGTSDCGLEEGHYDVNKILRERRFRPSTQWCQCLAWALCLVLSLSCLVLSAVLGMRFSSGEVLLWIHSLFISLMLCVFLIQPMVILAVAWTVSCWYRRRSDFHCFFRGHDGANGPEEQFRSSAFPQRCTYQEKIGARQRARYLRLVRPPTPAELRKSRRKQRRKALIHKTLRDLFFCASMLSLMMCITYGNSFSDQYHLNKAVRKQFVRNHDNAFMSIQKHEDWWKWTEKSLLDLLYRNASAEFGVIQQAHVVIGDPILQKTEMSKTFQNQVSMVTPPRTCGHLSCYSRPSATVGLGHTKSDAAATLKRLRSGGWLDGQTLALRVQFTLYSPAPNLFTSVTLITEQSPTGVLLNSARVQAVRVYHTPAVWDYAVMVCQLLYLFLSLIQLCHQVSNAGQQGLMGYWRTPCNWVEVSLLIATLVYYACSIYHSTVFMEVVELLQTHNSRGHVDVSLLATCEQFLRTLRGIMLFLLTMKCVSVLKMNRTIAASATLISNSLSRLLWPTISGLILLLALSCMGNLLHVQSSWAFSSIPRSLQTLLRHYRGLRVARSHLLSQCDVFYCGVLYLFSTVVWTALVISVMSSLVRRAKRAQNRMNVFTTAELTGYIRLRVSEFTGQHKQASSDNHVERRMYCLEEFESLVDELLFRLNALSNSLHHTLPQKSHRYREEDSPAVSPIPEPSYMKAQNSMRSQLMVNDPTDHGDNAPSSHLFRSQADLETLQFLQQREKMRHNLSSDVVVKSDDKLKGKNSLPCPESASLKGLWAEDALKKQVDQLNKRNDTCWLHKTQAAHTEVVVEVLIHQEPVERDGH